MSIVLSECAHTSKSVKLTALLITEYSSELCYTQRQILVRTWFAGINLAVVRTVHRLQHIFLVLLRSVDRLESILAVVSIVARSNIKTLASDTRSDNLLIVVWLQETAQQFLQAQTQLCALWQPDRQTFTNTLREHKELHLLTNLAVVALLSLLKHSEIFVEHLLLREGDTIDTSHLLALCIATPESSGNACNLDSLDSASAHEVRTFTEVCKRSLCIGSDGTVFKILFDMLALVLLTVGTELLQGISL